MSTPNSGPPGTALHNKSATPQPAATAAGFLAILADAAADRPRGLAIRLYVGWKTFLDFDEWQHVFHGQRRALGLT